MSNKTIFYLCVLEALIVLGSVWFGCTIKEKDIAKQQMVTEQMLNSFKEAIPTRVVEKVEFIAPEQNITTPEANLTQQDKTEHKSPKFELDYAHKQGAAFKYSPNDNFKINVMKANDPSFLNFMSR